MWPLSSEISYHLFSFAHIRVEVGLITPFCEILQSRTVTILRSLKETEYSTVFSKLNQVTVLLFTAAVVSVHSVEKGGKDTPLGGSSTK